MTTACRSRPGSWINTWKRSKMAKKILLIEDYEATVEMLTNILELNGYEVEAAVDGPGGVKKAVEYITKPFDAYDLVEKVQKHLKAS